MENDMMNQQRKRLRWHHPSFAKSKSKMFHFVSMHAAPSTLRKIFLLAELQICKCLCDYDICKQAENICFVIKLLGNLIATKDAKTKKKYKFPKQPVKNPKLLILFSADKEDGNPKTKHCNASSK